MQLRSSFFGSLALRIGIVCFAGTSALVGLTPAPAAAAETTEQSLARLDVTVSSGGSAVSMSAAHVEWNGNAVLRTHEADHDHEVRLDLSRSSDGKKVSVALRYHKDGAEVVTSKSIDAGLAEPVRIASADGKTEVVLVIAAEAPRKKIEVDDSDDPLGGL